MKKSFFEKVLNKTNKKDIDQWFGENSEIKVTDFSYSTNHKKKHFIHKIISNKL